MKDQITVNGITYLIEIQNHEFNIIKKGVQGATDQNIDKSLEEYAEVLEEYKKMLNQTKVEKIISELTILIINKEIKSFDELAEYYKTKGYTPEEIQEINKALEPITKENFKEENMYTDVYQVLYDELMNKRNEGDALNIEFKLENGIMKINAKKTIKDTTNSLFYNPINFPYTEEFKELFLNKFITDFLKRQHNTHSIKTYGITEADLNIYSKSRANLNIIGIDASYAYEIEKEIINRTKVEASYLEDTTYEEAQEEMQNEEQDRGIQNDERLASEQRIKDKARVRSLYKNNGNITIKFIIIFAAEAIMALALIAYLLLK